MRNLDIIIDRFGRDYNKASGDEINYNCPFCESKRGKKDNDGKLYVNVVSLKFYCFKCHSKGRLSRRRLESVYGVYDNLLEYSKSSDESDEDSGDNMFYIPNTTIVKGSMAYNYCMDRGIDEEKIRFYNIRLGLGDLFGRIVIPNMIIGDSGVWTDMFSSRTYIGQTPKYKNPEGCKKTHSVFNLHNIKEGCDDIYVVEGAITAICAGKEAVAVYGCHPSNQQISSILSKKPKNIYCVLDNDSAGRHPNELLADTFSRSRDVGNVYLVYMPVGIDAADMGELRFKEYVMNNKIPYNPGVYTSIMSYFNKEK